MRWKRISLVTQRKGAPNWYCNFTVKGHRFRDSLGTDDKQTAEILAAEIRKDALLGNLTNKNPEITLTEAFARYWMERGKDMPSADHFRYRALAIEAGLGKQILLSAIKPADLITYAASRRISQIRYPKTGKERLVTRAAGTINGELKLIAGILNRANLWGVSAAKIHFKEILLPEPADRQHILTADEEERLFRALRPDLRGMVRLALITGLRLRNVIELTWKQVNWEAEHVKFHIKSKKPGGETHYVPITKAMAALLSAEQGRHRVYVFTLERQRNYFDPRTGVRHSKGERYPFGRRGTWRDAWYAAVDAAGLRYGKGDRENFRFHDLRHTAATRALKATGNLKTVQHMLGHANIKTTARYARTDVEDVREAMELVEKTQTSRIALMRGRKA